MSIEENVSEGRKKLNNLIQACHDIVASSSIKEQKRVILISAKLIELTYQIMQDKSEDYSKYIADEIEYLRKNAKYCD